MAAMWTEKHLLKPLIERYTVGDDPEVDITLMEYEITTTKVHCDMLLGMGILTDEERDRIEHALDELHYLLRKGEFRIETDEEDCHGAIENFLIRRIGETAFKIHIFRSRNEQVLNIIRLFCRTRFNELLRRLNDLKASFEEASEKYSELPMPGYTHSQRAMPTTVGVWLGSFVSLLEDDITLIRFVNKSINRSPLGSAAGFGTSYPIDRNFLAEKLGYDEIQENPLSCQNGRGKETQLILFALAQVATTLAKFATDCLLFSTEEFGFLSLGDEYLTGSSIMPNKRNYDIFELTRARAAEIYASLINTIFIEKGLTSGYHRDFQMFKKPIIDSFSLLTESIDVINDVVGALRFNEERLKEAVSDEHLYATQKATEKALKEKIPYRYAYFEVKKELE